MVCVACVDQCCIEIGLWIDLPRGRDYDYRIGTKETRRVESMRVFSHTSVHMSQLLRENEFNAMFVHQSPAFLIV